MSPKKVQKQTTLKALEWGCGLVGKRSDVKGKFLETVVAVADHEKRRQLVLIVPVPSLAPSSEGGLAGDLSSISRYVKFSYNFL